MNEKGFPLRYPLLAMAVLSLAAGAWLGLIRLGLEIPRLRPASPLSHGPLMVSGFLGTLIAVERAIALRRGWTYIGPLLSGLGGLALIAGLPGEWLLTLGSLGLVIVFVVIVRSHPAPYTVTMGLGAVAWLAGNVLWLAGLPVQKVVLLWAGFLILTIAGERLELGRLLRFPEARQSLFAAANGLFIAGAVVATVRLVPGMRLAGVGMLALTLWLLRHDIARRTVQREGVTRFIAVCLLSGYAWLGIAGVLGMSFGLLGGAFSYDALLHAIFLGFVFAMIFGHAPIIIPAIAGVSPPYHPAFYVHLGLLHLSLLLRVSGDIAGWIPGRQWGGLINVVAGILFLMNTAYALFLQRGNGPPDAQS
ncbi:MAG TPA: hypothetical protein ENI95_13350 [Chloroflexi bacterium]|nr:hypothetical protein [Chloroflexota bacterium]